MPDISKIIDVTSSITGGGVLRKLFGIMMFVTKDSSILGTGANRIRVVSDANDAADAGFAVGTEPRDAMDILYQQEPFPKNCVIGRWIFEAIAGEIKGVAPAAFATLNAIADGSFECKGEDFTGLNLTGASDLDDIAALVETELQTGTDPVFAAATCVYNASEGRFEVKTGTTGAAATITVFSPVDPAVGTDVSILLGLDANAELNQGADAESISEAIEAILALNDSPYFICHDLAIVDFATMDEVTTWVASRPYMYFLDNFEAGALTPGESSSVIAQLFATTPQRNVAMWSATQDYKALSFAGRYSSVNFNQSNAIITGFLKQLPGTVPDDLNTTEQTALEEKYTNYYPPWFSAGSPDVNGVYNGTTMKPLVWADVRYFMDWAVNAVRVDVFNLLYNSPKVPQTEAGVGAEQGVIDEVMQQAVRNGGIAPGQVSAAMQLDIQETTGNLDFDGYLVDGYLIYAPGIATQSQSDRNERKSPPFKVWMKGSGAIHSVEIALTFEN